MKKLPKYRRPLNPNQLNTLLFIFKFRFVSSQLLASAFGNKSRRSTHQTLQTLEEQGYLAKRYDSSYKLQGRQATYYLLPKAVHEIQTRYKLNQSILKTYLRNSTVSDSFIEHHLDVLKSYIHLKDLYHNQFHIFSKYELADFDYFPTPRPDLYLNRIKPLSNKPNEYLLDIYSNTPLFAIRRRVDNLINHFESFTWQGTKDSLLPTLLIAAPNTKFEGKIQSFAIKHLDVSEASGLSFYTTTSKALLSNDSDSSIWSNAENPEKLISL